MKKLFLLLLITAASAPLIVHAQTLFQRAIGGTSGDFGYSIIRTTDSSYAVAGETYSFGAGLDDVYIAKLGGSGTLLWKKTVGGTDEDFAYSIVQTTDSGYAVAGTTTFSGSYDFFMLKLDGSGTLLFSTTVGGPGYEDGRSIIQTTDGGYAMAGLTSFGAGLYDMYIVKLFGMAWSKTIGGTSIDIARSIIQTTDGGYAVAGETYSFGAGSNDMYVVKLDGTGTLLWSKTVGGTGADAAYSIIQTTDGGFAVAGGTTSFGAGGYDMYITKLSPAGTLMWSKTIGGTSADNARSIIQTTDGGYAVAGSTASFGGGGIDMYIVKLDSGGTLLWSKTVGGTADDYASSIVQTPDSGYAVAGWTSSLGAGGADVYVVKLEAGGSTCSSSTSPSSVSGTGGTMTSPTSSVTSPPLTVTSVTPTIGTGGTFTTICLTVIPIQLASFTGRGVGARRVFLEWITVSEINNYGFEVQKSNTQDGIFQTVPNRFISGHGTTLEPHYYSFTDTTANAELPYYRLKQMDLDGSVHFTDAIHVLLAAATAQNLPKEFALHQNYPNPFNPNTTLRFDVPEQTHVTLKVYNVLGQEVRIVVDEVRQPGFHSVVFDASLIASGVYYYRIMAGDFVAVKKMLLMR